MDSKTVSRRRHGADLKAQVLRECERPGASVAAIALAHGLNANLVHKWRRQARPGSGLACAPEPAHFIALPLTPAPAGPTPPAQSDIRIELRRAALAVNVAWPVAAAGECGAWLRELLQ
ncbi:transposase [Polaromonas sp.]|uniref:IS66-like element accessory protein TnpA n=1 Tax=Polaromonas sp. TaxID=1869339 RepID=UPI001DB4D4CC|nr:transposase [Polaromonas sp.]MBT9476944.1 transposase [Polaromonas sp.]